MKERNVEAVYPLAPLQEGMLFHAIRDAETDVYFIQCTCKIGGELDPESLRRAWGLAAQRHSALRTLFSWERRERPLQVVRARVETPWQELDWTSEPAERIESKWTELLERDRSEPFELSKAPLIRLKLVQTGDRDYRLLLTMHHLLMDGWSGRLLLREVFDTAALIQGGVEPTPEAALPFGEFIAWLQGQDEAAAREHWTERLEGFEIPSRFDLGPASPPEDASPSSHGSYKLTLDEELTRALSESARQARVTLNTALQGAWAILLERYLGADDVVFGATVTTRPTAIRDIHQAVGLYMNTIPLRARVDADRETGDWLHELQAAHAADRELGHTALNDIQRWTGFGAGRDLFDTLVTFEGFPDSVSELRQERPFTVSDESLVEHSNYPLALLMVPDRRLELILVYEKARFSEAGVKRLSGHLRTVLEAFAKGLRGRLRDIPLLTEEESHQQLENWSQGAEPPPAEDVLTLIERHAAEQPEAPAIREGERSVTYADLSKRALIIGAQLGAAGAAEGTHVVILAERTADSIAAMLAALRIGAAYVAVDPHLPRERLSQILLDLESPVVATHGVAEGLGAPTVDLSANAPKQQSTPRHEASANDAAYVIFTSGSTGKPKGVVVERRGLALSTAARSGVYDEHPASFLLLSPLSVDSSVAGIYWALCTGGTLVLPPGRAEQDLEALAQLIESEQVTHTLLVPSLWEMILENADEDRLRSLRCVAVAGEACSPQVVERHRRALPQCGLYNEYGPSESTVWATAENLEPSDRPTVSIGRPIPGALVYLLDRRQRLLPAGTPGEICIGGETLARGYLRRPDLTAEKFLANPFAPGRLYRTGDLGRYLPDGRLEFLGRIDRQVKIRGHRVELEEIEQVLGQHPSVREAAVLAQSTGTPTVEDLLQRIPAYEAEQLLAWASQP